MLTFEIQSIGKATKFLPPKISKYNHPPTKKPKSGNVNPEVHIALNFAATPGMGPSASAIPSQTVIPSHSALTVGQTLPVGGSDIPVHTVNIIPTPGAGPSYPVVGQPETQSPLAPLPTGGSNAPVHASPMPLTQPEKIHASRMRIILDCRDASTVPSVLDLLTLMDQDCPMPDEKYVDALSEFYDFGVEDVLDVFDTPHALLASFGDLGNDRARQLHEYVRDKLLLPLGLLETRLEAALGCKDKDQVVKQEENRSIIEVGSQESIIKVENQHVVIKAGGSSVVEVGGRRAVVRAGDDSSIVEIAVPQTLPQATAADKESMGYSVGREESWPEDDGWDIKDECEERVKEWLAGVWEAEEEETESNVSYEV